MEAILVSEMMHSRKWTRMTKIKQKKSKFYGTNSKSQKKKNTIRKVQKISINTDKSWRNGKKSSDWMIKKMRKVKKARAERVRKEIKEIKASQKERNDDDWLEIKKKIYFSNIWKNINKYCVFNDLKDGL